MSDTAKHPTLKKPHRHQETLEKRQVLALEEIADALEGIQRDLAEIARQLPLLRRS